MQSLLNVITPESTPRLTTLARVKAELGIQDPVSDVILLSKIDEASSDIRAALGYAIVSESVEETFWHEHRELHGYGFGWRRDGHFAESLFLRRTPVSTITSVTLDGDIVDPSEYRLDGENGILYRLDSSGYPCEWVFCKALVIAYTGGYILPGKSGANLPPALEGGTVDLVSSFWFNRGRDPLVKAEDIPGVRRVDYWIGSVGDPELLPPSVLMRISSFRRPGLAVA